MDGVHIRIGRKDPFRPAGHIDGQKPPKTLGPWESMDFVLVTKELAEHLVSQGRKPQHTKPIVTTGRKHYPGKWDKEAMEVLVSSYKKVKEAADKRNPPRNLRTRVRELWPL